jgi:hypothetical protein
MEWRLERARSRFRVMCIDLPTPRGAPRDRHLAQSSLGALIPRLTTQGTSKLAPAMGSLDHHPNACTCLSNVVPANGQSTTVPSGNMLPTYFLQLYLRDPEAAPRDLAELLGRACPRRSRETVGRALLFLSSEHQLCCVFPSPEASTLRCISPKNAFPSRSCVCLPGHLRPR